MIPLPMRPCSHAPRARPWLAALMGLLGTAAALWAIPVTSIDQGMALTVWETDEGLPGNDVHAILQDHDGFLWVGTSSGLARFDGFRFRPPRVEEKIPFDASTVYSMVESAPGELVFVHDLDASNRLVVLSGSRIREHPSNALLAPGQRIQSVFAESPGVLWIIHADRSMRRWTESTVESFPPVSAIPSTLPASVVVAGDGTVFVARGGGIEQYRSGRLEPVPSIPRGAAALARARDGSVWMASLKGLQRWRDGRLEGLTPPTAPSGAWPPQVMLETRDGTLWLGFSQAGLHRLEQGVLTRVRTSHDLVRNLLEDREGNLWVCTAGGGLNRIRRSPFSVWGGEAADTIGSICEDRDGGLWLGNARGVWTLKDGEARLAGGAPGWPEFAHAVCPDGQGALWFGGRDGVYRFRRGVDPAPQRMTPPKRGHVFALHRGGDGSMWAGGEAGPLLRYLPQGGVVGYGPEDGFDGAFAQAFGEDSQGRLWVGTRQGGLYVLEGERFRRVPTPLDPSGTGVLTVNRGRDGALWLGTRGLGLLRMKQGGFHFVGTSVGLPHGVISQVLPDSHGNWWIGSSDGLFRVALDDLEACADLRKPSLRAVRYGRADGIAGFYATGQRQPCCWKGDDGTMWFVGRKGVVRVDPSVHRIHSEPPGVFIDDVRAGSRTLASGAVLGSSDRRLEFRFTSPHFASPGEVRFRHRLVGLDTQWSDPVDQRETAYPRLEPGAYRFQVVAVDRMNLQSLEPAEFVFTVAPMWWERPTLRVLALGLLLLALVLAARRLADRRLHRRMEAFEQARKVEQERIRIARDLHDGIGSGLTRLGWLAGDLGDDAEGHAEIHRKCAELGGGIRELARDLDAAVWAVSPRHDTLASLVAYLCEFAAEHFRRTPVRCRVSAPDSLPALRVPPHVRNHVFMAAKEALNNALKHSGGDEVRLAIAYGDGQLDLLVSDDGRGFDPHAPGPARRHGLGNLAERMREVKGAVAIDSGPQGTRVHLRVPLTSGT